MSLYPMQDEEERFENIEEAENRQPSLTYRLDFERGCIQGLIDDEFAIRQFIRKTLATQRFYYLIYDDQYGSELDELISADVTDEYLQSEIPRIITDALIHDDRIASVHSFEFERKKGDLYVTFAVETDDGLLINEEVVV